MHVTCILEYIHSINALSPSHPMSVVSPNHLLQDDITKLEQEMDERHAAEVAALEQRERDAAGPQAEATNILNTDLYSFTLNTDDAQKLVRNPDAQRCCTCKQPVANLLYAFCNLKGLTSPTKHVHLALMSLSSDCLCHVCSSECHCGVMQTLM